MVKNPKTGDGPFKMKLEPEPKPLKEIYKKIMKKILNIVRNSDLFFSFFLADIEIG